MNAQSSKKNEMRNIPKIVQIIPCNVEMYAVTNAEDGGKFKNRVVALCLCNDGEVYPLHFDNWFGVSMFCDAFIGVSSYEMDGGEVYFPPEQEGAQSEQE